MQTIFLSDLKAALLEHPQAWITQMEQQHWAQLRTIAEEIAEHRRTCPIIWAVWFWEDHYRHDAGIHSGWNGIGNAYAFHGSLF